MSALFEKGFFVREPAWHGLGVVLNDYPSREKAMELAGHNWDVVELRSYTEYPNEFLTKIGAKPHEQLNARFVLDKNHVSHVRSDTGALLHKPKDSFERISNSVAYDVAELLFDQGFKFEAGVTLDGGKRNAITLLLDEAIQITGDNSVILPFGILDWAHDGTAALKVRSGTIRVVCMNTATASEAEGKRLGTDFTFRHTKNVHARIEDAKKAIQGVREGLDVYREVAEELAALQVTPAQRDWFVSTIIGDRDGQISKTAGISDRVKNNIESERVKVNSLFMKLDTIPEAHALTGYGLFLAGGEYFDHLRNFRTKDSYVKRTILTHSSEKSNLRKTIAEAVAA